MHSKFGLFQMSSLSLCAALSKVNFVVYYKYAFTGIDLQLKLTQVLRGKLTHLSGGVVSK